MQHARPSARHRRGVLLGQSVAGRLDAVDIDLPVVEERMKQAHGVRAAADAGEQ